MSPLGVPRVHRTVIDSTNAHARQLAADGAPHGLLVTADEQTAGRGRQGRTWVAPAGRALLASLILREPPALLALRAGLAVAAVAEAFDAAGRPAAIKWPNDVQLEGRKVAGILVEGRPQEGWAVLGVGLNVALATEQLPEALRDRAATLDRSPGEREAVLAALLRALESGLAASTDEVLAGVRARDALRDRPVRWAAGAGTAAGIDERGRLLVATAAGARVALDAGEVHLDDGRPPVSRGGAARRRTPDGGPGRG